MKKRRFNPIGAFALAVATALSGGHQANAVQPSLENVRSHQQNKESKHEERKIVRPQAEKNKFGGFSGEMNHHKHIRKGVMNQRQLRKFLRQNPSQRKKYGK